MPQPNLLIIMSDQHNPHVLGHAGDPHVRTPHLDRMAGGGVAFSSAYCAGPVCVPSRMSFLTARYPSDIAVWTNRCILNSAVPTFAHALSFAGWETVLCGRMHFCGPDQHHGFERRWVGDASGALDGRIKDIFAGVWSPYGAGQTYRSHLDPAVGPGRSAYMAYDEDVTARVCRFLRERASDGEPRPFCMVAGLLLPHNPYVCPGDLFEMYMDLLPPPDPSAHPAGPEHPAIGELRRQRGTDRITREQARRARAAYYGMVTLLDRNVGRMMEALESSGMADRTTVLYTSDHGDLAGEHGLWWKDCFHEGSVRIPMVWSQPGRFPGSRIVDRVASLLDVGPTLAELAGADPLPAARGHSLLPLLEDRPCPDWPDTAFAEIQPEGLAPGRMIRSGPWKLNLYHGHTQPQLFNLETDPGEERDLGDDPACADVRRDLLARVREGWSGETIEQRLPDLEADATRVEEWCREFRVRESERWPLRAGNNLRDPEETGTEDSP